MRSYAFYLYTDDGELLQSLKAELRSDEEVRQHIGMLLEAHPSCEEMEVWEKSTRYVMQGRRRSLDPTGARWAPVPHGSAQGNSG